MPDGNADFSKARFANVFSTPLLTFTWEDGPELNALLRERILTHEKENVGVVKSNHGSWHSETGHLEFCGDVGQRLVRRMYELGDEATRRVLMENGKQFSPVQWTLSAWVNVNRTGDFNKIHVHPGSTWSGTYYVDAGDPVGSETGALVQLFDPCQGRSTTFMPRFAQGSLVIHPKPGLMILFPSCVPHMVYPHNGNSARISVAFNLRMEPYP
jgi:uncharacterized protein (TIGR02466 family)